MPAAPMPPAAPAPPLPAADRSWAQLAATLRAENPLDLADAFIRLGLRTPALELLETTPSDARAESLFAQALSLPDDSYPAARRLAAARANVDALRSRGIDLTPALDAWSRSLDDEEWLLASDGNIVRRDASTRRWTRLRDERSEARAIALPADLTSGDLQQTRPITIEGIDPPWLLQRIADATPPSQNGHRPRIQIVQSDISELLNGLACADLSAILSDERVRLFVGDTAAEALKADLRARFDTIIAGPLIRNPSLRAPSTPSVESAISEAAHEQGLEHDRLTRHIAARYGSRDPAWWRERFGSALSRKGPALRVLVPTCRYSTFVRHSAEDLADACRALGHEALVVMEPDDSSRMSSVAYLRAFERFEPDLVLMINYTRSALGPAGSARVPFVCWVQDAMPQLFDKAAGSASGPLDFLAGYTADRLFTDFGHPRERAFHTSVGVSPRKFHRAAVSDSSCARFECEIAYVGHQSETVDDFHARQSATLGRNPAIQRVIDLIRGRIIAIASDTMSGVIHARIDDAVRSSIREISNAEPDPRLFAVLLNQYAMPLADRAYRHETLEWAADIARRRGWRLRLFGRGWDRHPTLGAFAAGPLEHGEDLRACYQTAGAHLHAAILSPVHQRPVECALSGGLPLVRFNIDEVHSTRYWLLSRASAQAPPDCCSLESRRPRWWVWNHAPLLEFASLCGHLGLPIDPAVELQDWAEAALRRIGPMQPENLAHWLYAGLNEACFCDRSSLEARLTRAVERPQWRRAQSEAMAFRMSASMTTDAILAQLLAFIADRLGGAPSPAAASRRWPGPPDVQRDVSGLITPGA